MMATSELRGTVIDAIVAELERQDKLWGANRQHPNISPRLRGYWPTWLITEWYNVPTADRAKERCSLAYDVGDGSWADILLEEFCEALEEGFDDEKLYEELIQVAAVAAQWAQSLRARKSFDVDPDDLARFEERMDQQT